MIELNCTDVRMSKVHLDPSAVLAVYEYSGRTQVMLSSGDVIPVSESVADVLAEVITGKTGENNESN